MNRAFFKKVVKNYGLGENLFFHSCVEVLAQLLKSINYIKPFHWRFIQLNRCKNKLIQSEDPFLLWSGTFILIG
jgi:hypothetical protein